MSDTATKLGARSGRTRWPSSLGRAAILAAFCCLVAGCASASRNNPAQGQPVLREFDARVPALRAQVPAVVRSAQAAGQHIAAHPEALLNVPYREQMGFSEEMLNRAGGLAHAYATEARQNEATDHDVVLLSVRSWEKDGERVAQKIKEYRSKSWTVTLIASSAGKPQDLVVDYFIDNGAPSPAAEHGRINALANVTLGWMWCCEYVSAMTREGKIPGVLISVALPGAEEYDAKIQTPEGRHKINPCETAVPPGRLAEVYLKRIERAIADLKTPRIQDQVRKAADIVAARMAAGEIVGLSALGHLIIFEVMEDDRKAPWKQFFGIHGNDVFERTVKPGELLVWIAYMGMDSAYASYGERIERAKVDLISSYAPPLEPAAPPARQLAHIEQPWEAGDAVVPLPCEPGSMAPASGIISTLIFRMLDDEVAARLAPPGQSASPAAVRRASRQPAPVAH